MGASRCGGLRGRCSACSRPAIARAQSPQEKKRGDILNELGLKKKPPAPPPASRRRCRPTSRPPRAAKRRARPAAPPASRRARAGRRAGGPAAPSFARAIHPLFVATCKPCHAPGAPRRRFTLAALGRRGRRSPASSPASSTSRDPEASVLLGKVSGATLHAGGAPWPTAERAVPAGAGLDPRRRPPRCAPRRPSPSRSRRPRRRAARRRRRAPRGGGRAPPAAEPAAPPPAPGRRRRAGGAAPPAARPRPRPPRSRRSRRADASRRPCIPC